jgi:hypothetical protein
MATGSRVKDNVSEHKSEDRIQKTGDRRKENQKKAALRLIF